MCNTHGKFFISYEVEQIFITFDEGHFCVSFFFFFCGRLRFLNHLLRSIGVRITFFKSPNTRNIF